MASNEAVASPARIPRLLPEERQVPSKVSLVEQSLTRPHVAHTFTHQSGPRGRFFLRLARIPSRASARRSQVRFFVEHLRGQFPHGAETLERTDGPCGPLLGVGAGGRG